MGLAAFGAYAFTAPKQVIGGDNGEFSTLFATGGVAHPPGFPLYVLVLRAFAWLPVDTPARGAALVTALVAALAVFALWKAARTLGASARASGVFAAVYAFSPLAWKLGSTAEVFSLNVLIALVLVIVAGPEGPLRGAKRAGVVALVAGLGLANHHSIVLLLPVGVYGLLLAFREAKSARLTVIGFGLAGLGLGLLPYLDLVWRATHASPEHHWIWGEVYDFGSLVRHFLRAEYGTTELGLANEPRQPVAQNAALARSLLIGLLGLPMLALAGALLAFVRKRVPRPRAVTLALALAFILTGPVFVSLFNLAPRGLAAAVVERFYLLPSALLCVVGALAMDAALGHVSLSRSWHLAWAFGPVAAQISSVLPEIGEHNRPTVGLYVHNVLATAPKDLVILGSGDQRHGGFSYADKALGHRRDVVYVSAQLLLASWYRKQASARLGFELPAPENGSLDLRRVVSTILTSGRSVALTGLLAPGLTDGFSTYPLGPLIRALPPETPVPDPNALELANRELYAQFEIEARPPAAPESFAGRLHGDYARPWLALALVHAARNEEARAIACRNEAFRLAPWTLEDRR